MNLNRPTPAFGTAEAPLAPDVVRAFGEVARERFGLARMERNVLGLARRLRLALVDAGRELVHARQFVREVSRAPAGDPSLRAAADAITNRETWFFRDPAQLDAIVARLSGPSGERPGALRVLSVGCSSGEELYSVAIHALSKPGSFYGGWVNAVGIDLSPKAIDQAKLGAYRKADLVRAERGPDGWLARFFREDGDQWVARPWVAARCRFRVGNLVDPAALEELGEFDLVLCRNVLIYFDPAAKADALVRLSARVRTGGLLALGAAEAGLVPPAVLRQTAIPGVFEKAREG